MSKFQCILYNETILKSIQEYSICLDADAFTKKVITDFLLSNNIKECFGDFGEKFKKFLLNADRSHPELFSFTTNLFGQQGLAEIKEVLELQKYCLRKKYKFVPKNLHRLCDSFSSQKIVSISKNIDAFEQTKVHTRFLGKDQRWQVRSQKKSSIINLSKKNQTIDNVDKSEEIFICYHHNSQKIGSVLADLEKRYDNFVGMNCLMMAAEINAAIEKIKIDLNLQSFGFHRITLNVVARNLNVFCDVKGNVRIHPVTQEIATSNDSLRQIVSLCESFPVFCGDYAVFDHYAFIKDELSDVGIIVGERDAQSFFLGYYYE